MKPRARIPLESSLSSSPEQSVGLVLPVVLSDRLDALVVLAEEHGERTNRKEIVSSLLLAAEPSGDQLAELIRKYRHAAVAEALVGDSTADAYVAPVRKPGPRPRRKEEADP